MSRNLKQSTVQLMSVLLSRAGKGVTATVQIPSSGAQADHFASALQQTAAAASGEETAASQTEPKGPRCVEAVVGNAAMLADAQVTVPPEAQHHLEALEVRY